MTVDRAVKVLDSCCRHMVCERIPIHLVVLTQRTSRSMGNRPSHGVS